MISEITKAVRRLEGPSLSSMPAIPWSDCDPADVLLGAGELRAESEVLKYKLERRIVEVALGSFQVTVALPNDGSEVRDAA